MTVLNNISMSYTIKGNSVYWDWGSKKVGTSFTVNPYSKELVSSCYASSNSYFKRHGIKARVSLFKNGNGFVVKIMQTEIKPPFNQPLILLSK